MPATRTKSARKGDELRCEVCGLSVVVDEICGCAEAHEIICCDVPMKTSKRSAAKKTAAKPKAKVRAKK